MKVSTKIFNSQTVEQLDNLNEAIQKNQQQIFTGRRISKPSDDPVLAVRSSIVEDQLAQTDQFVRNLDLSEVKLKLADTVLDQLTNLSTRIYELAVAARNQTNKDARQSIAIEIEGLTDSIRDLANTRDASGRSIFAGYKVDIQPFEIDQNGKTIYKGDRGIHTVKISDTLNLNTTIDGAAVFQRVPTEAGKSSVFDIIDSLVSKLKSGKNTSLPIDDMKIAASHFADKRALIGAELNKADNQRAVLENRKTTLTEAVGQLKDADMAKVVTELQTLLLNKEASQKAFAMVSRLSLFDYIT